MQSRAVAISSDEAGALGKYLMAMKAKAAMGLMAALIIMPTAGTAQAQGRRPLPYWASISEPEARMRVGPSLDYPSNWVYRRRDLPVRVVQVLGNWRKIEDSTGTQGWMHVRLLSDAATAIIAGSIADLRESPSDGARLLYRAEPGVVGRTSQCANGWCALDVHGQKGFVRASSLWGNSEK